MFVRCKKRFKDGKEHRYWSVVENVRVSGGRVVQRQVLYLGEINDSQRAAWCLVASAGVMFDPTASTAALPASPPYRACRGRIFRIRLRPRRHGPRRPTPSPSQCTVAPLANFQFSSLMVWLPARMRWRFCSGSRWYASVRLRNAAFSS